MFESSCIRLHAGRQLHAVLKGTSIQVTLVYYHGLLAFVWTCLCRDSFVASECLLAGTVAPGTLVQRRQLGIVLVDAIVRDFERFEPVHFPCASSVG